MDSLAWMNPSHWMTSTELPLRLPALRLPLLFPLGALLPFACHCFFFCLSLSLQKKVISFSLLRVHSEPAVPHGQVRRWLGIFPTPSEYWRPIPLALGHAI